MADMYPDCQVMAIKVDLESPEEGMKQVIKHLRPNWPQEEIVCKPTEHGLKALNLVYTCRRETDTEKKDALVVKLIKDVDYHPYPKDNDREVHNWVQLNKFKVGVPLLGRFQNGIVQKFMAGSLLNEAQTNDPHIARLVAEELAKFHEASRGKELYVDKSCGPGDLNWGNPMTRKCIQTLKEFVAKGEHSDVLSQFITPDEMEREFVSIKARLEEEKMEVVVCHNDCWRENILYDQKSDILTVIDYEILDRNYAPYDIGVYLIACADNPPEIEKKPSESFCKDFIRAYLSKRYELQGMGQAVSQQDIDLYYRQACLCMPVRCFYISIFCLYFYLMNKTPFGWKIARGFYQFYLDSRALYWPK